MSSNSEISLNSSYLTPVPVSSEQDEILPGLRTEPSVEPDATATVSPGEDPQLPTASPESSASPILPNVQTPNPGPETRPSQDGDHHDDANSGITIDPKWKQHSIYGIIFGLTILWLTVAITFIFLSSSEKPRAMFSNPKTTVFFLSLVSTLSVFLLNQCALGACDALRWTLAARPCGVSTKCDFEKGPMGLLKRVRFWGRGCLVKSCFNLLKSILLCT